MMRLSHAKTINANFRPFQGSLNFCPHLLQISRRITRRASVIFIIHIPRNMMRPMESARAGQRQKFPHMVQIPRNRLKPRNPRHQFRTAHRRIGIRLFHQLRQRKLLPQLINHTQRLQQSRITRLLRTPILHHAVRAKKLSALMHQVEPRTAHMLARTANQFAQLPIPKSPILQTPQNARFAFARKHLVPIQAQSHSTLAQIIPIPAKLINPLAKQLPGPLRKLTNLCIARFHIQRQSIRASKIRLRPRAQRIIRLLHIIKLALPIRRIIPTLLLHIRQCQPLSRGQSLQISRQFCN